LWRETHDQALTLRPEHFSLYSLIIEEAHRFVWVDEGRIVPGGPGSVRG